MTTPSPAVSIPATVNKHTLETAYRVLQIGCLAVILVVLGTVFRLGSSPTIAFAFSGAFLLHMALRPSRCELVTVVVCAAMFGVVYYVLHGDVTSFFGATIAVPCAFLGLGSLLVMVGRWFWAPEAEKRFHLERAKDVILIPAVSVCSTVALNLAVDFTPITYDRLLYVFDLKFGGPPSWMVGGLLRTYPWLLQVCGAVYNSLPLGLAAGMAIQLRDRKHAKPNALRSADLRWLTVALGIVGFLLYQVCPVAGPLYLFGKDFPFHVPDLTGWAIQPAWLMPAARNGMPSLHVGWTLLLFWNIRRRNWWMGVLSAAYLVLTALATLGFGEHYLADLMVAPALALAIQAACTRTGSRIASQVRWVALATGAAITLVWLMAFRTGAALRIPEGAATWTIAIVSVVLPAIAAWQLERASNKCSPI